MVNCELRVRGFGGGLLRLPARDLGSWRAYGGQRRSATTISAKVGRLLS